MKRSKTERQHDRERATKLALALIGDQLTTQPPDPDRVWLLAAPAGSEERRLRLRALGQAADERGEPLESLLLRLRAVMTPNGLMFRPLSETEKRRLPAND